jgi:hypothetical protein
VQDERPQDQPRRRMLLAAWWSLLPIVCLVLVATAVEAPIFLVPAVALLAFAWMKRDDWNWPTHQRYLTFALFLVVFLAFLMQRFVD